MLNASCSRAIRAALVTLVCFFGLRVGVAAQGIPSFTEHTPSDASDHFFFGSALALNGNTLAVGAFGKNTLQGAVYIFGRTAIGWQERQVLTASDAADEDRFGASVAISGRRLLVGAPFSNHEQGRVYVFTLVGNVWKQTDELSHTVAHQATFFGTACAFYNDLLVIGSAWSGQEVYIYAANKNKPGWTQTGTLTPPASDDASSFGPDVAAAGNRIFVSAVAYAPTGSPHGVVYVYEPFAGKWNITATILLSSLDRANLAVSGNLLVAFSDSAYVYQYASGQWTLIKTYPVGDNSASTISHQSVAIYGKSLAVGINRIGNAMGVGTGSVNLQNLGDPLDTLIHSAEAPAGTGFGYSVAIGPAGIIIGSPFEDAEFGESGGAIYTLP